VLKALAGILPVVVVAKFIMSLRWKMECRQEHYVMRFPQPLCCIFGHEHRWIEEDIFGDGMMYYGCPNIEKRTYILYTLTPDGYSYEKVDF